MCRVDVPRAVEAKLVGLAKYTLIFTRLPARRTLGKPRGEGLRGPVWAINDR